VKLSEYGCVVCDVSVSMCVLRMNCLHAWVEGGGVGCRADVMRCKNECAYAILKFKTSFDQQFIIKGNNGYILVILLKADTETPGSALSRYRNSQTETKSNFQFSLN